jgi:ABC-type oligopeptide transport system substrate-binding subunit
MSRILIIPAALLVMLAGAMLWSGGGVEKRAEFAFINRGDIHTLDLNTMSYMQDFRITYGIREGLYNLDGKTTRPIPALAVKTDLSPDKKTYTFHLREEGRWSNGDPVTAHDFVFSWRHFLTQPGEYTYLFDYIKGAKEFGESFATGNPNDWDTVGFEAVDAYTLKVTLNNPVRYFLDVIAFCPFYPRHERSMASFRRFVDEDAVMAPFERYVAAAKKLTPAATPQDLASAAKDTARTPDAAATKSFVEGVKTFDVSAATEKELLEKLALFAALNVLDGPAATTAAAASQLQQGGAAPAFDTLSPKEKLARMLRKGFVRFYFDKKYTRPPHVVTNGAYILKEWDFARRLRLEKNDRYWDKANVRTNTVEMVVAENPQSQLLMYETGVVDWHADVPGDQAAELRRDGRTDVRTADAFGTNFLTLMCNEKLPGSLGGGKNPLADVRVRQALAMAIDKRYIVETITRMGELPARTFIPPDGTLPEFVWKPGLFDTGRTDPYTFQELKERLKAPDGLTGHGPGLPYDPDRARKLLAEAGYPNGQGFPRHPVLYNTGNPTRRQIAQVVNEQWRKELGIDLPIRGVEGKIFQPAVTDKDYFIATVAWYGDYPDITTFTEKYKSTSLQNDSDYRSKAFDELCHKAEEEQDDAKRVELLSRAEHMLDTEMPIIPLYHYVNISMSRDHVRGVTPNARNITIFKDVWIDRGAAAKAGN